MRVAIQISPFIGAAQIWPIWMNSRRSPNSPSFWKNVICELLTAQNRGRNLLRLARCPRWPRERPRDRELDEQAMTEEQPEVVAIDIKHAVSWFKHQDPQSKELYQRMQVSFTDRNYGYRV